MSKYWLLLYMILVVSCSRHKGETYDHVLTLARHQYPIPVRIAPNGKNLLLKERDENSFILYAQHLDSLATQRIKSSKFTQLSLTWHPNSEDFIYQEFNPETRRYDLYHSNIHSKKNTRLTLKGSTSAIPPLRWSETGVHLAYLMTNAINILYIYDPKTDSVRSSIPNIDTYGDFQWYGDTTLFFFKHQAKPILSKLTVDSGFISNYQLLDQGEISGDFSVKMNRVLFIAKEEDQDFFQCYEHNFLTGETSRVTEAPLNVVSVLYSKHGDHFYYGLNENGKTKIRCSDAAKDVSLEKLNKGAYQIVRENENSLIVSEHNFRLPEKYIQIDFLTNTKVEIHASKKAALLELNPPEFVSISSKDSNLPIPAYFWKSKLPGHKKVILYIHGGPYLQTKPNWNFRSFVFTEQGFDVLALNYRGSSGYSSEFADLGNDVEGQVTDVISSVDFLKSHYGTKEVDITLMGSSYGGGLALQASKRLDTIAGVVLVSGVINSDVEANMDQVKAKKILGFYGEFDQITPNAYEFFRKNNLVDSQTENFIVYQDEGHFFHKTSTWSSVYATICEMFGRKELSSK